MAAAADDASAIDTPTCWAASPHNALPTPSPPWRQEGGADDSPEAEAGEQQTVAQGTEAEVPARDHG